MRLFSLLHILLKILATLQISYATVDLSIQTLKRIKTWLRKTIVEKRLIGLTVMNIHRDISLEANIISDRYLKE